MRSDRERVSRHVATRCMAVVPALILVACGAEDPERTAEAAAVVEWGVDSIPLVSIGVVEGEAPYILSRIVGVEAFRGGFLIADGTAMEIRRFDREGRHVETVGGAGEGPGEFVLLRSMHVIRGDTVLAWDLRTRRLTVLDPSLQVVSTETMASRSMYVVSSAFGSGELLLWPFGALTDPDPPGSVVHPAAFFAVYRRGDGTALDTVVELPARPSYVTDDGGYVRLPFTADPQFAAGDSTLWAGSGQAGTLVRITPNGDVVGRLELPPGALIPPERIEREEEETGAPGPERYPSFDRLVVDDRSRVWTRAYLDEEDEEQQWTVREPEGQVVGTVVLPRSLRVTAVEGERIIGVWRDELDVESVRVYRMRVAT